ncbi:MAG: protein usg, partial [Novosphingobium sp.]|nr:protein usg [Novosphingobium sp.]
MHASEGFRRQIEGYGLTTAQIYYRMPDCHSMIQEFVWQQYDLWPKFPELK